ncbi:MAG: ATP-dependent sacrificial sulfur transferase LarE [Geobacteraceae bacterium]|nr:ATP-dependent sacrificial sulfur transferase LarE [Geobacteraceae bacterium]
MAGTGQKIGKLKSLLQGYGSVLVAFSGGVDSSLLLKIAVDTLGDKAVAFTEASPLHQAWEVAEAQELAKELGVTHIVFTSDELDGSVFSTNPPDRCYICKKSIFARAIETAKELGLAEVIDGSNVDDLGEYRPGRKALAELQIKSPLLEAGFTKKDIRSVSRKLGLPTWNRQSLACLASRFPYGTAITVERLRQVELCETFLRNEGFSVFRVRYHGDSARIEVKQSELKRLISSPLRERIIINFKAAGFTYVAVDLEGFRSGSMDEQL